MDKSTSYASWRIILSSRDNTKVASLVLSNNRIPDWSQDFSNDNSVVRHIDSLMNTQLQKRTKILFIASSEKLHPRCSTSYTRLEKRLFFTQSISFHLCIYDSKRDLFSVHRASRLIQVRHRQNGYPYSRHEVCRIRRDTWSTRVSGLISSKIIIRKFFTRHKQLDEKI